MTAMAGSAAGEGSYGRTNYVGRFDHCSRLVKPELL